MLNFDDTWSKNGVSIFGSVSKNGKIVGDSIMSLTILIIDDEPYLPHQFARFLRRHGYEVHVAADGETGLAEMQRNTIDLVLLDLRLPKISGLDLLTQIRKIDQDVPVVM